MRTAKALSRRAIRVATSAPRTSRALAKTLNARNTRQPLRMTTSGMGIHSATRASFRRTRSPTLSATMDDRQAQLATPPTVTETRSGVTLYFSSTWPKALLHYSLGGSDWTDTAFTKVENSDWHVLELDGRNADSELTNGSPMLEFVITDGNDSWEKPQSGENYEIAELGVYSIADGAMELVALSPVMVVSDLDGTMIGDDTATAAFRHFWKRHRAATNSVLVYNTGRSLESFLKLLEDKRHCLEIPDVLVSAVGTKIYQNQSGSWPEDPDWIALLDEGWNLAVVQTAAQTALEAVGPENMHFRPVEEQNEHKVTCGVKKASLEDVITQLESHLKTENVEANIISSGIGEWRFLDIVSKKAGKLEALEYVRKQHEFTEAATVACGDSGNDILMLSGINRAIVVSNAQPDLIDWLQQQQSEDGHRLYLSQQHEAYGILEGLKKFGFY